MGSGDALRKTPIGPLADFALDPAIEARIFHIGDEKQPVLVVDNLLAEPGVLLRLAASGAPFQADQTDFYPGVRKPLPPGYSRRMTDALGDTLRKVFHLVAGAGPDVILCTLSIATTAPGKLLPIQRIPHFDTAAANQLAVVHYLCPPSHGGTSFYRHRRTGYEVITEHRVSGYRKILERQATTEGLPRAEYICGDTALFERIATVEARFNRAVFYRSNALHSGDIDPATGLSGDPDSGRLTATTFIRFG